ncbi:MAG: DUF5668 domain-containing protein [Herbinix sp.]|nr:DUF5668 domain-containing protein [Herbinix sp.]
MTKTHRVGTVTLGGMLIAFGILFLLRIFVAGLTFDIIFKLWPVIFIFLGAEILIANFAQKQEKLIYDKTAFALIIILSFFAMGMAITEFCLEAANAHLTVNW